jgi:hypothetical protein
VSQEKECEAERKLAARIREEAREHFEPLISQVKLVMTTLSTQGLVEKDQSIRRACKALLYSRILPTIVARDLEMCLVGFQIELISPRTNPVRYA